MKRLFSGMQPTGAPHIGNYLGAIENWITLQDEYDALYCIVDLHSLTIDYDPAVLQERVFEMAAVLLAAGLKAPEQCSLFVQSDVKEHTELAWLLNTVTPIGELYRMTQFKSKSDQHQKNINAGLLTYPVLQTADIALYKGEAVPVGEDQVQHIELARIITRKFNNRYGKVFPEPQEKVSPAKRIMGLDGAAKMSKSLNNQIDIIDEPDTIWDKLRVAVTDPARKRKTDPGNPFICNIHTLHTHFSSDEEIEWCREGCKTAGIGCFQCKRVLADNIANRFAPIRERTNELKENRDEVKSVLKAGAERARAIASETINEVHRLMGIK